MVALILGVAAVALAWAAILLLALTVYVGYYATITAGVVVAIFMACHIASYHWRLSQLFHYTPLDFARRRSLEDRLFYTTISYGLVLVAFVIGIVYRTFESSFLHAFAVGGEWFRYLFVRN